ncbi:MurR/RpiR family transcriptional regulator [Clostridium estertheticum]|uniref:MurR/RpiR family transcriptional regulator n=1 Tax=Clostridium estertheticum TaxID=238834 RepID=UPI001C7D226E|nr:MurR/RpiR family transcriptional regulator [Clostridium estertheticum]MBX4268562.1 MurR/RpiR family transcriptional regulator [Clostridium estertheticum]WLC81379.1 MurR/RpiR family transcriptional regulator [Clostridium estertheticum]
MENNKQDLMKSIQAKFLRLSKGQKLIAQYILKHYDKAAFMTAAKLGIRVGVSEATVIRFANEFGFNGYPKLQKSLQELIKNKLTTMQRFNLSYDSMTQENVLDEVLKGDIENIRVTLEKINNQTFEDIVNSLFKARKVYIIGLRSSSALAEFLAFYLNLILENVQVVAYGVSDIFEQMFNVDERDIIIGIGFARYATRTIEALEFVKSKHGIVVAITDSLSSPLASNANYTLIAQSNITSFVDSLVAPFSVINALIIAVELREKEKVAKTFSTLESIWEEYNVYSLKDKDNKYL